MMLKIVVFCAIASAVLTICSLLAVSGDLDDYGDPNQLEFDRDDEDFDE